MPLLRVEHLTTSFHTDRGKFSAVDDISFSVKQGESVGLVGESGSGKSVTSLSIMQLISCPPGEISGERIEFEGVDLLAADATQMRKIRGNRISMIFQEPMTSLNPVFKVGEQIAEVYRIHESLSKKEARIKAIEMLRLVRIPEPEQRYDEYPHQLSGGMRQRIMIAMALACRPALLIADEPTTALDVTIQAQILSLIRKLTDELNMAVLLITHDLGVVAENCDHVIVMYGGKIVEDAPTKSLFEQPLHPYTQGLFASIPRLGHKSQKLPTIPGSVPALGTFPPGCKFRNRCQKAIPLCAKEPPLKRMREGHAVACWVAQGVTGE